MIALFLFGFVVSTMAEFEFGQLFFATASLAYILLPEKR